VARRTATMRAWASPGLRRGARSPSIPGHASRRPGSHQARLAQGVGEVDRLQQAQGVACRVDAGGHADVDAIEAVLEYQAGTGAAGIEDVAGPDLDDLQLSQLF